MAASKRHHLVDPGLGDLIADGERRFHGDIADADHERLAVLLLFDGDFQGGVEGRGGGRRAPSERSERPDLRISIFPRGGIREEELVAAFVEGDDQAEKGVQVAEVLCRKEATADGEGRAVPVNENLHREGG